MQLGKVGFPAWRSTFISTRLCVRTCTTKRRRETSLSFFIALQIDFWGALHLRLFDVSPFLQTKNLKHSSIVVLQLTCCHVKLRGLQENLNCILILLHILQEEKLGELHCGRSFPSSFSSSSSFLVSLLCSTRMTWHGARASVGGRTMRWSWSDHKPDTKLHDSRFCRSNNTTTPYPLYMSHNHTSYIGKGIAW